jgi:PrgI family protein
MQRNVPQFIEIEDKIFGPFTLKQFGFLMGGFGLCVIVWRSLPLAVGIFIMGPIIGLSLALAFAKFNTKPFIDTLRAALVYFTSSKKYTWQSPSQQILKQRESANRKEAERDQIVVNQSKNFSSNDIRDLANRLNTK